MPKILVCQKGAREHYLVARALLQRDWFAGLILDWDPSQSWLPMGVLKKLGVSSAKRAAQSIPSEIPKSKICALNTIGLINKIESRVRTGLSEKQRYALADRRFAEKASKNLRFEYDGVFAYSYAALEILVAAKKRGATAILGQIDPGIHERKLVIKEERQWPQYVSEPQVIVEEYETRNQREWDIADWVVVNSKWSKKCMEREGADPDKIRICPLAYEPLAIDSKLNFRPPRKKLRLVWLGTVSVRKGFPRLIEALESLDSSQIEVVVAGPIDISRGGVKRSSKWVKFVGTIPRSEISNLLLDADLFVLPTISDGFAITQLEAMAHGLPVIATERCGEVVEHQKNGLIVEAGNTDSLAKAIESVLKSPDSIVSMRKEAVRRSREFSLQRFGEHLAEILQSDTVDWC